MNIKFKIKSCAFRSSVKTVLLTWMLSLFVCGSFADDFTTIDGDYTEIGNMYNTATFIPVEFTYGHIPLIISSSRSTNEYNFSIYDENLNLKKKIDNFSFAKQVMPNKWQNEERDIIVNKVSEEMSPTGKAFKDLGANYVNGIEIWMMEKNENGDTLIWFYTDKYNDRNYYHARELRYNYPTTYNICKNGMIYSVSAQYDYHYSDWRVVESEDEPASYTNGSLYDIWQLFYSNANTGVKNENSFLFSQTLFNQDDQFECVVSKQKSIPRVYEDYSMNDQESEFITKRHVSFYKTVFSGFQIISETGEVIKDIEFDGNIDYANSKAIILIIGNHTYLVFNGYSTTDDGQASSRTKTYFYEINRETSSISKAKMMDSSFMSIEPLISKKNSAINVTFGDDNKGGSEISVVSASGAMVKSMQIPAGQKSAQFSVNGTSGIYCVSRTQKGKPSETKKIIIK